MPALDQVVNVSITQSTAAVAQASFGIPLIIGPTNPGWTSTDYVHSYSSAASMLTDGYSTSSPEYQYALALTSQPIQPTQFLVGRRTGTTTAQVDIVKSPLSNAPPAAGTIVSMTVNGVTVTYTAVSGDTTVEAYLGHFSAAINAKSGVGVVASSVTGTGGSAQFTITSLSPGIGTTYSTDSYSNNNYGLLRGGFGFPGTTANAGIQPDLANIQAQNNSWYGFCIAQAQFTPNDEILQAAAWTEAQKKIYLASSNLAGITTLGGSGDIGQLLQSAAYKRTALLYTVAGYAQGAEAAWLGGQLPQTPGSNNWAFKTLNGITADVLSDTARSATVGNPGAGVVGRNVNIYTPLGGINVTQFGTTASGQYIDITIGIDWLQSTIQTNVWSQLALSTKIPYTDAGTAVIIQAVRQAIDQGVVNKLIAPDGITISAPSVTSVSTNQRAQRIAPTVSFSCRLQGAFNAVTIAGNVSV